MQKLDEVMEVFLKIANTMAEDASLDVISNMGRTKHCHEIAATITAGLFQGMLVREEGLGFRVVGEAGSRDGSELDMFKKDNEDLRKRLTLEQGLLQRKHEKLGVVHRELTAALSREKTMQERYEEMNARNADLEGRISKLRKCLGPEPRGKLCVREGCDNAAVPGKNHCSDHA